MRTVHQAWMASGSTLPYCDWVDTTDGQRAVEARSVGVPVPAPSPSYEEMEVQRAVVDPVDPPPLERRAVSLSPSDGSTGWSEEPVIDSEFSVEVP